MVGALPGRPARADPSRSYTGPMPRLLLVVGVLLAALTLFALFDALLTPAHRVRALPRWGWALVVLLLPLLGPVLWLALGRLPARRAEVARPSSPDDDEDFLRSLRRRPDGPGGPGRP